MKPLHILTVLCVICVSSFLQAADISGVVYDASTGRPLYGAEIILNSTFGTATADDGTFKFSNLKNIKHILNVSFIGYKSITREVDLTDQNTLYLEVYLSPQTLDGESIVVTAIADPNRAIEGESPIAFSRIDRKEISRIYTTDDLPRLIREVPGVWTSSAGLGESEIYLRGFPASGIRFMVNDIPINNPEDHSVVWSNWAGLAHLTRSIEVQRGPGYGMYSSNAFGGTININTMGIEDRRLTMLRASSGFYHRAGILDGPHKGKVINPENGILSSDKETPIQYTYSGRFNSGPLYGNRLNATLFFERKKGESYIRDTGYDGYTIGLEAESVLKAHTIQLTFLLSTQYHGQAFALQDFSLLKSLGREYNRKNHEWQENFYTKPFISLRHDWKLASGKTLTSHLFYTFGRGADQTCANDLFDVETGNVGYQEVYKGVDAYAFGMHAQYLFVNFGLLTTDFTPGLYSIAFKDIPISLEKNDAGINFFADLYTNSYQNRIYRNHKQLGLLSYMTHPINNRLSVIYGIDARHWRGRRKSDVHFLRVSNLDDPYRPLWIPYTDPVVISNVQSIYDYDTDVTNLSASGRISWKPTSRFTFQGGLQLNYTRSEVIENPIKLIDFGNWGHFEDRFRTSADTYDFARKFGLTNDYLRQFKYANGWIGASYNPEASFSLFSRLANAKREPAILDWYDFSNGPLKQKSIYTDDLVAVDLVPETVLNTEIGGSFKMHDWLFKAGLYHSIYYDKIESVVEFNGRRKTLNAGKAHFQGLETTLGYSRKNLDFTVSATVSRNRWQKMNVAEIFESNAGDVVGKVVPFSPERMLSSSIYYQFGKIKSHVFRAGLRLNYWDEYYATYTNAYTLFTENIKGGLHFIEEETRTSKLPYFLEIGASLDYTLTAYPVEFNFRLDANNILNRSDNYMRAQYTIDHTRNDFYKDKFHWYILQAPLFNLFFTMEIRILEEA